MVPTFTCCSVTSLPRQLRLLLLPPREASDSASQRHFGFCYTLLSSRSPANNRHLIPILFHSRSNLWTMQESTQIERVSRSIRRSLRHLQWEKLAVNKASRRCSCPAGRTRTPRRHLSGRRSRPWRIPGGGCSATRSACSGRTGGRSRSWSRSGTSAARPPRPPPPAPGATARRSPRRCSPRTARPSAPARSPTAAPPRTPPRTSPAARPTTAAAAPPPPAPRSASAGTAPLPAVAVAAWHRPGRNRAGTPRRGAAKREPWSSTWPT